MFATEKEILQVKQTINLEYFLAGGLKVSFVESGVGVLASCYSVSKLIFEQKPDLIVQAGIAGTFDHELALGDVVIVKDEVIADSGVEEKGGFKDLFDLKLQESNLFPFYNNRLINREVEKLNYLQLKEVSGITINEITTRLERIKQYKAKYNPVTETMEGASLHYCCLQAATSFIQIRAISNYIGERNKSKWKFDEACKNLSDTISLYLDNLYDRINIKR
jgi:futalosine hydrolase